MENKNKDSSSIIPIRSTGLVRVRNILEIVDKILYNDIQEIFNKAFFLLNSKNIDKNSCNYLLLLQECSISERNLLQFSFEAKEEQHYIEAINLFSNILEIKPNNYLSIEFRGIAKYKSTDLIGAINDLNKAISNGLGNKDTYYYLAVSKFWQSRDSSALDDFNNAINCNPIFAEAYLGRGMMKSSLSNFTEGIEDFNKAINFNPDLYTAYYSRASANRLLGNYKEALKDYDFAIENIPNAIYFWERGLTKQCLKDFIGAITDYNKSIEANEINNTSDYPGYFGRGKCKSYIKDYKGAISDFTRAIKYYQNYEIYFERGISYFANKEYSKAIEDFSKAIDFDSSNPNTFHLRGGANFYLNQYDLVINDTTKSIELDTNFAISYKLRGMAKQKIGDSTGASIDEDTYLNLKSK